MNGTYRQRAKKKEKIFVQIKHHLNFFDLIAAAAAGCTLCKLLHETFSAQELQGLCAHEGWTIQDLDEIDESLISYSFDEHNEARFQFLMPSEPYVLWRNIFFEQVYEPACLFHVSMIAKLVSSVSEGPPKAHSGYRKEAQGSCIEKRHVARSTGSTSISSLAINWIQRCSAEHENCRSLVETDSRQLPTRLISVHPSEPVHLCDTTLLSMDTKYTTLSHRWGKSLVFTLTSKNIEILRTEIQMTDLSQTFQDSITFTRSLGIDYIWIDSLCIIQDSEDDWHVEAARMANVYRYGWCNIAATEAKDGKSGLFVDRNDNEVDAIKPKVFKVAPKSLIERATSALWDNIHGVHRKGKSASGRMSPGSWTAIEKGLWDRNITESELLKRGWVLQERILALRIIHFRDSQIFYECMQFRACESFPAGLPSPLHNISNFKEAAGALEMSPEADPWPSSYQAWQAIVEGYTRCDLTFEKDKLIAISGVASRMKEHIRCRYVAGLWEHHLLKQLLWDMGIGGTRPKNYQAPSWSWASTTGQVEMCLVRPEILEEYTPVADILDVSVTTIDGTEMGSVIGGHIRLKACLIPATPASLETLLERNSGKWRVDVSIRGCPTRYPPFIFKDIQDEDLIGTIYLLPLSLHGERSSRLHGLALKRTTSHTRGRFRRVGIFNFGKDTIAEHGLLERALEEERSEIRAQDMLYEKYDTEEDKYIITIV